MNLSSVMAELAGKLSALTELRVYPFPPDALLAPAVVVGYPQSVDFDVSASRGVDRMTVPMTLIVERTWDRSVTEHLSDYTAGAGSKSVKQLVQTRPHTSFSTARVRSITLSAITLDGQPGTDYWAAQFIVDITGPGGA